MFLAAMPTKDPITLTMGTDTPHVSLTFAAISPEVAQASQSTVTPLTPVTPTVPKPTKSPVVSTMKRLAKTTTADKADRKSTRLNSSH